MRRFRAIIAVAGALLAACAGGAGVTQTLNGATDTADGAASGSSPVPAPRPGILGCVESRELKAYVLALDAHRHEARNAALLALGASVDERRGAFGSAGAGAFGEVHESAGKRFAVAAELAPHLEPRVMLAKRGPELRRIDERPRGHAVDVLVCGIERCPRVRSLPRTPVRPLLVELAPGERWGGTLELAYDYWWARVRYHRRESCPSLE